MKLRKLLHLSLLAFVAAAPLVARQSHGEQNVFTEDSKFQKPADLSQAVIRALLNTEAGKQGLKSAANYIGAQGQQVNPAELFRGGEIHLNESDERALLVIGVGLMSGADHGWFWIVQGPDTSRPEVICYAGGNSIEIMDTSTHGYRDIRSTWASAAQETHQQTFHFNGKKYFLWKDTSFRNHQ